MDLMYITPSPNYHSTFVSLVKVYQLINELIMEIFISKVKYPQNISKDSSFSLTKVKFENFNIF
jgi:hypothetical protein